MLHVPDNSYDFDRTCRSKQSNANVLADWILAGKNRVCQLFVDHRHKWTRRIVLVGKGASVQNRNAHDFEMVGAYAIESRRPQFGRPGSLSVILGPKSHGCIAHERKTSDLQARRLHSWNRCQPVVQLLEGCANFLGAGSTLRRK